ncbi:hypothetical protein ACS0TY_016215 [Phlomoides rotata]
MDDTLFLGKASDDNLWFLIILELVLGKKVNIDKYSLYGLNLEEGMLEEYASFLGCRKGMFPFVYLGVMVGSSHIKTSDWEYVVRKIKNKLRRWEGLNISIGGRLGGFECESKIPWFSWDTICLSKTRWGLGVKNLEGMFFLGFTQMNFGLYDPRPI